MEIRIRKQRLLHLNQLALFGSSITITTHEHPYDQVMLMLYGMFK